MLFTVICSYSSTPGSRHWLLLSTSLSLNWWTIHIWPKLLTFDGCRGYNEHLFKIIMCKQIMILKQWITWLFFTSCIIRSFPRVLLCRKEASSLPKTSYWPTLVTFLTLINRIKIEERREDLIRNLKYLWRSRLYFNWTFSTESLFFRFSKSVLKRSIRTTRSNIFWSN